MARKSARRRPAHAPRARRNVTAAVSDATIARIARALGASRDAKMMEHITAIHQADLLRHAKARLDDHTYRRLHGSL
jgi:hypothetical protein